MYFFDSYALIEIIKFNESYIKYKDFKPICTNLNLFELHQALLREFNKQTADYWITKFDYVLLDISREDIILASDLRFKYKDRKLSMADCIGYILAKKNNLKFLTGDNEFKDMDNVEFVK
jgi:hypothetical protein